MPSSDLRQSPASFPERRERATMNVNPGEFADSQVPARFKLFALWSSAMFFYIYGDYFELYQPGKLLTMLDGKTPFGPISQGVLLGMSAIMILPCLMPFLSLL